MATGACRLVRDRVRHRRDPPRDRRHDPPDQRPAPHRVRPLAPLPRPRRSPSDRRPTTSTRQAPHHATQRLHDAARRARRRRTVRRNFTIGGSLPLAPCLKWSTQWRILPELHDSGLTIRRERPRQLLGAEVLRQRNREDAMLPPELEVRRLAVIRTARFDPVVGSDWDVELLGLVAIEVAEEQNLGAVLVGDPTLRRPDRWLRRSRRAARAAAAADSRPPAQAADSSTVRRRAAARSRRLPNSQRRSVPRYRRLPTDESS